MERKSLIIYGNNERITIRVGDVYQRQFSKDEIPGIPQKVTSDLETNGLLEILDYVVCPGGAVKPLKKGCYWITDSVMEAVSDDRYGTHIYNRLTMLAGQIGDLCGKKAVMMYPMSSDELSELNRCTSNSKIKKYSRYHALEHQIGQMYLCDVMKKRSEEYNCIIAYIGDHVSVGAHESGICVDVNDCLGGEGPMGLRSSGDVPVAQIAGYFSEKGYSFSEMEEILSTESGLYQYTGCADIKELDQKYCEDDAVKMGCASFAYQIAKWIGSSTLVLGGKVDGILLMGEGTKSREICSLIMSRVSRIAPVYVLEEETAENYFLDMVKLLGTFSTPVYDY